MVVGWEVLLILLVPLGVWILSSIFKGEDQQPRSGTRANMEEKPQRRPVTDLDRFLEEARRRREAAQGGAPKAVVPARPQPKPIAAREQRPAPERKPASAAQPRPALRAPQPSRQPILLEAVPEVQVVARAPVPRAEAPTIPASPPAMPPPPPPVAVVPRVVTPVKLSPALARVTQMLSSPQAAAAAIVLREIFERPLCQRRRR